MPCTPVPLSLQKENRQLHQTVLILRGLLRGCRNHTGSGATPDYAAALAEAQALEHEAAAGSRGAGAAGSPQQQAGAAGKEHQQRGSATTGKAGGT